MTKSLFADRWRNMSDPRFESAPAVCDIEINEGFWSHGGYEHLGNADEPWADVLGPELYSPVSALVRANGSLPDKNAILAAMAAFLHREVCRSLDQPLVLLIDVFRSADARVENRQWESWQLVLPCGAKLAVKSNTRGCWATTCFFIDAVCRQPLHRRWLDLLQVLVMIYGRRIAGKRRGLPDKMEEARNKAGLSSREKGRNRRFVTPAAWGFIDHGSGVLEWERRSVPGWKGTPVAPPVLPTIRLLPTPPPEEEQ